MSRFYVGQRVRIARSTNGIGLEYIGLEGRIVAACVLYDANWHIDVAPKCDGISVSWRESELEPLTDPGRELVSWESCAWKPEHLRERV